MVPSKPELDTARRSRRHVLIGGFGFLAASIGCKVGPNFKTPIATTLPNQYDQIYKSGIELPTINSGIDVSQWWTYFDDPVLQSLIEDAIQQNLSLKEAAWRIAESRARAGVAKTQFFPQVNAKAGPTYRNLSENASQFTLNSNSKVVPLLRQWLGCHVGNRFVRKTSARVRSSTRRLFVATRSVP